MAAKIRMTAGLPPMTPWPMNLNCAGSENSDCGVPCVMASDKPRTITMKARDAMKWLSPMRVTHRPISAPTTPLAAMAARLAVHGSTPIRNSLPVITMAMQTTEPTDRSIPPKITSRVMPTTTMPSMENDNSIARRLRACLPAGAATGPR
ncbi:hypothetical protein G6F65_018410 [Rhizopus arrhizus]|nr:hypothetical protein G6F65_018410 [Rhizopus arrhizus]